MLPRDDPPVTRFGAKLMSFLCPGVTQMRLPPVIIIGLSTVKPSSYWGTPSLGNPYVCLYSMFAVAGIPNGRQTTNVTNEPLEKTMLRITNPTQPN